MISTYLFFGLALLAVLGALGLILFKHPMNGAMSFVVTLISLAGLYALLSAKLQATLRALVPEAASLDDLGTRINTIFNRDGIDDLLLGAVQQPGRGNDATVFGRVRITQHDFLLVARSM